MKPFVLGAALALAPAVALADEPTSPPAAAEAPAAPSYRGVVPGGDRLPPHAPRLPTKGPARVTWTGFEVKDGTPTVFVELTAPTTWTVATSPGAVVVTLKNVRVPLRNNRLPLELADFDTVATRVRVRPHGKDVDVVVTVKKPVASKVDLVDAAGGFKMLLVALGPGS